MSEPTESVGSLSDYAAGARRALDEADPGYLDRVRNEAERLGVRGRGADVLRDAVRDVQDVARIDIDPPTGSSQPGGRFVKDLIKRSVQWYVRYLGTQITSLGQAMVRLGEAVADRIDEIESSGRALESKVDELSKRLGAVESEQRRHD